MGERGTEKGSAENATPEGRAAGRRKLRGRRARDPEVEGSRELKRGQRWGGGTRNPI